MDKVKVIHQINDQTFEIREIEYFWSTEIQAKKEELGITYDDVTTTGWTTKEYPAGRFIIKWHTNFNYGKQTFANAFIFYVNSGKETKTFIDYVKNVPSLESIAELMNKYANITYEQLWELFENSIERLGHYHRLHRQQKDFSMDIGYEFTKYDTLDKADFDVKCLNHIKEAQATAVTLQRNITNLHRMAAGISETADPMIKKVVSQLQVLHNDFNVSTKPIFYNGKLGQEHIIGDMTLFVDHTKDSM